MKRAKSREPAYVKHRRELLESPAWRALTLAAIRVLERLEIELMRHAGKNNGKLVVTYQQFAEHGIRYPSIRHAIRLLVRVGLLEVTQHGWRAGGLRRPATYRLTYFDANGAPPTDEWKSYISGCNQPRTSAESRDENVPGTGDENVPTARDENVPGNGIMG